MALQYVTIQTNALCLIAVMNNGNSLQFVNEQTDIICLEAFKQTNYAYEYIDYKYKKNYNDEIIKDVDSYYYTLMDFGF
jgi:hypothetical protein